MDLCLRLRAVHKIEETSARNGRKGSPGNSCRLQPRTAEPGDGMLGPEMWRLKDRTNEFCLGPTHEEILRYCAKRSKFIPPAHDLYQIQTKYRMKRSCFGRL